jgi:L-aminopeptidase/D-esterase-like protein
VREVNAVCLAGGSAFGLEAAAGVMRLLAERGVGHETRCGPVPIVPAACIYDLNVGDASVRPDAAAGRRAAERAAVEFETGTVGAGTGATCGKWRGIERAVAGGVGTTSLAAGDVVVGCIAIASPVGDIVGPSGEVLRGAGGDGPIRAPGVPNTVLAVVATNGRLTRTMCTRAAARIPDGIARAIRPAHTLHDGDTGFFVSTGAVEAEPDVVFQLTMESVVTAIRAVAEG